VATIALGLLLLGVAAGIAYDAILRVQKPDELLEPALFTLLIAAVSIISKEALYHATRLVAKKIRSPLLEANAWHHRSDAVSSIVVFAGIGGTYLGFPLLDAIAAMLVAIMIGKIGLDLSLQSMRELVDTALHPDIIEKIRQAILNIDDVRELHNLRSRRMGHNALIDVHIQVSPKLSVSEGHHIAQMVEKVVIESFEDINDVTVHIDPEEDDILIEHLPRRSEILHELFSACSKHDVLQHIADVTLHYLDGHVSVEARLPILHLQHLEEAETLKKDFQKVCKKIHFIGDSELHFC
jgi:cation diffusion facilitator family transporter